MSIWFFFVLVIAYGGCVGSFLNVVIYRLPLGINLVTPPSACPKCQHRLAWYDNVPVLGWLWLAGRCRYCKNPISIQYPIIEAITAVLFGSFFAFYYMSDLDIVPWRALGLQSTWPVLMMHLILLAGLLAATIIDGKLFIIPLAIPRVVTMVAVVGLPLATWALPVVQRLSPTTDSAGMGMAIGGGLGLWIANILLAKGILPYSFSETSASSDGGPSASDTKNDKKAIDKSKNAHEKTAGQAPAEQENWSVWQGFGKEMGFAGVLLILGLVIYALVHNSTSGPGGEAGGVGALLGTPAWPWRMILSVLVGACVLSMALGLLSAYRQQGQKQGASPQSASSESASSSALQSDGHADHAADDLSWLGHPHPRREVLKELLFLMLPIVGAILGYVIWRESEIAFWPWAQVLGGCVLGYLAGCGVVWFTRIGGTLLFGKEAMGLGDVHLVGAIGAVLGPTDAVLLFFIAPFFGLLAALVMAIGAKILKRPVRVIPYGPYLAAAAAVVMIGSSQRILQYFGIIL